MIFLILAPNFWGFLVKSIFLLFLVFSTTAYADYFEVQYEVKEKDTFGRILAQFLKSDSLIRKTTPMVIKTRKDNPRVKNWKNIEVGSILKISLKGSMVDEKKLKGKTLKRWKKFSALNKKFQYSFFYMMSSGTFKQIFTDKIEFHYC